MDFCSTDRSRNTSAANNDAGMRKWPIGKPESGPADRAIVLVRNSRHDGQNEGEDHPINHHASPRRRRHATDLIRQCLALMEPRDPDALRLDTTPSEAQARLVLPCRGTLWTTS